MNEPLALEDIAGLSLTMMGVLIEQYIKQGYADPTMFHALNASAEIAEQYKARVEYDGASHELVEAVGELVDNLKLVAIEAGEVVDKIMVDQGWDKEFPEGWA